MLAGMSCKLSSRLRAVNGNFLDAAEFFAVLVLRLGLPAVTSQRHRHGNSNCAFGRNAVETPALRMQPSDTPGYGCREVGILVDGRTSLSLCRSSSHANKATPLLRTSLRT